jgi:hypothetical protein
MPYEYLPEEPSSQDEPKLFRTDEQLDAYLEQRQRNISSLNLFAQPEDYDMLLSAGDIGNEDISDWNTVL